MALADRKRGLRRKMLARLASLSLDRRAEAGQAAVAYLIESLEFQSASRVALFASLDDEIATRPLFEAAGRAGKRRLLPRVVRHAGLEFAELDLWEELVPGRYGVPAPPAERTAVPLEREDLAIVPGLAFDRAGGRLGRGKGYYDRTFPPGCEQVPRLFGLAFGFQVLEEVPMGPGDRRVAAIVTEKGLLRVGPSGALR